MVNLLPEAQESPPRECKQLHAVELVWLEVASYPGLPMFFNVAREKSGRPGRSGDVIRRGYVYPAYSPTPFTTWP